MNTIESMAEEIRKAIYTLEQGKPCKAICEEMRQKLDTALTTYQAEKSLLEKTADWHEHGTVAPSCVGCPTAKAMIEGDWIMVRRERLIAANPLSCNTCIAQATCNVKKVEEKRWEDDVLVEHRFPAEFFDTGEGGACSKHWLNYFTERSDDETNQNNLSGLRDFG